MLKTPQVLLTHLVDFIYVLQVNFLYYFKTIERRFVESFCSLRFFVPNLGFLTCLIQFCFQNLS